MKNERLQVHGFMHWKPISPKAVSVHSLRGALKPLNPNQVAGVVPVEDLWVEEPLEADRDWTVAYRIFIQDRRAIVAEIRVFPTEAGEREPGQWSAEWFGRKAEVPQGGLSTRSLRSIRLGPPTQSVHGLVARVPKTPDSEWLFDLRDVSTSPRGKHARANENVGPRARRGRPSLASDIYSKYAAAYAAAIRNGSRHPIVDLAKKFGEDEKLVRSRINRARERGLLEPGQRGRAGGVGQLVTSKGARDGKKTRTR